MRSGYIRHLVYSSSSSSESPYFPFYCSSLVTAMSRYKSPAKKFCQIFGDNFGGKYKFRNLFPNIQLDISCLPLWVRPSNLKKKKTCQNQSTNHLNLKKSKTQFILKPSHQKLSSIII